MSRVPKRSLESYVGWPLYDYSKLQEEEGIGGAQLYTWGCTATVAPMWSLWAVLDTRVPTAQTAVCSGLITVVRFVEASSSYFLWPGGALLATQARQTVTI